MSGSLDTSILVQLVTGQTKHLAAAAEALVEGSEKQLAVADGAIIELIFVLEKAKKLPRKHVVTVVEVLLASKKLNLNRALFARALPMYATLPALSIHDCCLATYAELNGAAPLWTFDQKLAKQATNAKLVQ